MPSTMCRPSNHYQRSTTNFVQPPTQIDVMFAAFQHKMLGASLFSVLLVFLGSSYNSFVPSIVAAAPPADDPTSVIVTPVGSALGLFLAACLAALQLRKLQWETVVECVCRVDDVVTKVSSSPTMARIKSSVSTSSHRLVELAKGQRRWGSAAPGDGFFHQHDSRKLLISAPESFLETKKTADLSLSDLKDILRFALDVNRLDFRSQAFLSTLSPGAREAAETINQVVADSRGSRTAISTPTTLRGDASDMDALSFAAAVRVYAEWRSLRLVPEGYQRYSVAMNLVKRDLLQNVQKIETAAHNWMSERENSRKSAVDLANGRQVSRHDMPKANETS